MDLVDILNIKCRSHICMLLTVLAIPFGTKMGTYSWGIHKWYGCLLLWTGMPKADDRVAKSDGGDVRGTWLQLICCTLPC